MRETNILYYHLWLFRFIGKLSHIWAWNPGFALRAVGKGLSPAQNEVPEGTS